MVRVTYKLALLFLFLTFLNVVFSQNYLFYVKFFPDLIALYGLGAENIAKIEIYISSNAPNISKAYLKISYNTSIVSVTRVEKGDFKDIDTKIDKERGIVEINVSQPTIKGRYISVADIVFAAKVKSATSEVKFEKVELYDERGNLIPSSYISVRNATLTISKPVEFLFSFNNPESFSTIIKEGEIAEIQINLSSAPTGLAGYIFNISFNKDVIRVLDVEFPAWAKLTDKEIKDDFVLLMAVDLEDEIRENSENINLATLTIKGIRAGESVFLIQHYTIDDDKGERVWLYGVFGNKVIVKVEKGKEISERKEEKIVEKNETKGYEKTEKTSFDNFIKNLLISIIGIAIVISFIIFLKFKGFEKVKREKK